MNRLNKKDGEETRRLLIIQNVLIRRSALG